MLRGFARSRSALSRHVVCLVLDFLQDLLARLVLGRVDIEARKHASSARNHVHQVLDEAAAAASASLFRVLMFLLHLHLGEEVVFIHDRRILIEE